MTYVVTEACIKCKYTDCVEVCPVDCFYEGENMRVIHPDECIDCAVCEPEWPAADIQPDTEPSLEKSLEGHTEYAKRLTNITPESETPPHATKTAQTACAKNGGQKSRRGQPQRNKKPCTGFSQVCPDSHQGLGCEILKKQKKRNAKQDCKNCRESDGFEGHCFEGRRLQDCSENRRQDCRQGCGQAGCAPARRTPPPPRPLPS